MAVSVVRGLLTQFYQSIANPRPFLEGLSDEHLGMLFRKVFNQHKQDSNQTAWKIDRLCDDAKRQLNQGSCFLRV